MKHSENSDDNSLVKDGDRNPRISDEKETSSITNRSDVGGSSQKYENDVAQPSTETPSDVSKLQVRANKDDDDDADLDKNEEKLEAILDVEGCISASILSHSKSISSNQSFPEADNIELEDRTSTSIIADIELLNSNNKIPEDCITNVTDVDLETSREPVNDSIAPVIEQAKGKSSVGENSEYSDDTLSLSVKSIAQEEVDEINLNKDSSHHSDPNYQLSETIVCDEVQTLDVEADKLKNFTGKENMLEISPSNLGGAGTAHDEDGDYLLKDNDNCIIAKCQEIQITGLHKLAEKEKSMLGMSTSSLQLNRKDSQKDSFMHSVKSLRSSDSVKLYSKPPIFHSYRKSFDSSDNIPKKASLLFISNFNFLQGFPYFLFHNIVFVSQFASTSSTKQEIACEAGDSSKSKV